ncbi:DNA/RNA nuclease SfsA [Sneathiella sp.]|uniref:DNA/RNA nuclease SfsA n=1 Tax=Sneathiella sp. TaxID=1964365 RepID=UPI002FE07302
MSLKFPAPLQEATLIKRYKRFLADVELADGRVVTAHVANSGSMMGLNEPGLTVWLSRSDNPARKLPYSWELVAVGDALIGVNTAHPNAIVAAAIKDGRVPELAGYSELRREVKYGANSRIDILLQEPERSDCYVEVKNVTLAREPGYGEFPDAVTARGTKHLHELANVAARGARAVMFYLIQRTDCHSFRLADDIDPAYAEAFDRAKAAGVEILCYDCHISAEEIRLGSPVPIIPRFPCDPL